MTAAAQIDALLYVPTAEGFPDSEYLRDNGLTQYRGDVIFVDAGPDGGGGWIVSGNATEYQPSCQRWAAIGRRWFGHVVEHEAEAA